jgi:hypothetical protein
MKEFKPVEISDVTLAYPAKVTGTLLPLLSDIPQEFKDELSEWCAFASRWFSAGAPYVPKVKEGLDEKLVWRHLQACMHSYEPDHNHKLRGVAYLLSLWCEPLPEGWDKPKEEKP